MTPDRQILSERNRLISPPTAGFFVAIVLRFDGLIPKP
jgi:hypothetical protein